MNKRAWSAVLLEPMTDGHADAVLGVYQSGIDEGNATFETRAPSWEAFSAVRPENIASRRLHASAGSGEIGLRERIAAQHSRWRDVVLIERRSRAI